jgi:hypothetical protein
MGRVLPVVIIALLTIYCLVEVAQADPGRVRLAPRWLWAAAVIVLPLVGPLAWLALGRPQQRRPGSGGGRPPLAPDDDPDFLRRL